VRPHIAAEDESRIIDTYHRLQTTEINECGFSFQSAKRVDLGCRQGAAGDIGKAPLGRPQRSVCSARIVSA
jgi:hypothetical protein